MRFPGFSDMLNRYARSDPDAPALRWAEDGAARSLSYAQLAGAVERRAEERRADGGTCLGVFADGSAESVTEIFAAARAGMQTVLLDAHTPLPLLRGLLAYTDVDRLWGPPALCEALTPNLTAGVKNGAGRLLFFTSGTTERAKAVVLTEKSLCSSAYNGGTLLPLSSRDTLLCLLPLHHVFGFVCGLLWGLSCGAGVALGKSGADCALFRPTVLSAVPLQLRRLLAENLLNDELRLLLVGAGECPHELLNAAAERGLRVSFGYGLTETSSGVALSLGEDPFAMTVCPDHTVSVAADGEILVKVRSCMMKGYYKCPADTNAVLIGGMLHTGDLGYLDERGRLHVTGRKKDRLVLPDGTKLSRPEAEAELRRLLGGADLALVLRDGRLALVVAGDSRSDDELFAALAPYQRPRPESRRVAAILRQSEPLPRTPVGKLQRWELENRLR